MDLSFGLFYENGRGVAFLTDEITLFNPTFRPKVLSGHPVLGAIPYFV
jgi:hypothetical protein